MAFQCFKFGTKVLEAKRIKYSKKDVPVGKNHRLSELEKFLKISNFCNEKKYFQIRDVEIPSFCKI